MNTKNTVLVIENSGDLRQAIQECLGQEGYTVSTAVGGIEALQSLRGDAVPHWILLDMQLRGMSGREFLREKAMDHKLSGIPTIIFTATEWADRHVPGVAAVLPKPFPLNDLIRAAEALCVAKKC